ncbi:MAG: glucose-1-phosphate adenylyltransferase [Ruminococcaceae bacterium]|nr:glucose-1-phosphate adenylyltransferase [Oscillospiraceae bacterium]
MFRKKEWIAMLLAGGQGSRLGVLTKNMAKPALPFGCKYRIIDFTLSNCVNSGIDTVGVLTQYQPLELNEYIGNGSAWDLNRMFGGVHILPPYQQSEGGKWYKGTANAVYQNLTFIDRYDPEYVIVLSGDHIYKMDYEKMLEQHKKNGADCSIAVLNVPLNEASRFGIMNADEDGRIFEFEEKPKHPKSTLASMGVYIFNYEKLKKYLKADEKDKTSDNDFGKNIIPQMLSSGEKIYAYRFDGYWKDVGTIKSLWQANMDILDSSEPLKLSQRDWRIYSQNPILPPQFVSKESKVTNSIMSEGCEIYGEVKNSVIFSGVKIGRGCRICNSVIMPDTVIGENCKIDYSIVGSNCILGSGCRVNGREENITVLANKIKLADKVEIAAGEAVRASVKGVKTMETAV